MPGQIVYFGDNRQMDRDETLSTEDEDEERQEVVHKDTRPLTVDR